MDQAKTHLTTSKQWVGSPVELSEGKAVVELETLAGMAVDGFNLIL